MSENVKVTNHNLPDSPVTELAQSALDSWGTAAGWVPVAPGDEPAGAYMVNTEDLTAAVPPAAPATADATSNPPPPPPPPTATTLTSEV